MDLTLYRRPLPADTIAFSSLRFFTYWSAFLRRARIFGWTKLANAFGLTRRRRHETLAA
jgi:hypothetical protein